MALLISGDEAKAKRYIFAASDADNHIVSIELEGVWQVGRMT